MDKTRYAGFSDSQSLYRNKSANSWFNVAEGGKRAGKNILNVLCFCFALETHPAKMHLIAGASQSTARINIMECDGLGIINHFRGRCRAGKFQDRMCLYIKTKVGEKIVIVAGGDKVNSKNYIQGFTLGCVYLTEANLLHPTFIQETFDRTMSFVSTRKIFHDLNPKAPTDNYYTEFIEPHEVNQELDSNYGYNYGHFTLADNMSMTFEDKKAVLTTVTKGTVHWKRDILGLRAVADGLIYLEFANNHDDYIIDELHDINRGIIQIGVDFGGNKSGQAFVATLIPSTFDRIIVIEDYWNDAQMDSEKLANEFLKFIRLVQDKYPKFAIANIYADSAEQVLKNTLQSILVKNNIAIKVSNSRKNKILDRIRFEDKLLATKRLSVMKHCKHLIQALDYAQWNPKKQEDERLDNGTSNMDSIDAFEYSWETKMDTISKIIDRSR